MKESIVATHGTEVAVWEVGRGHPLLVLHGLGLDHVGLSEELERLFEDGATWRRIYLDLPGMGRTPGHGHLASADALLEMLTAVVEEKIGENRFAVFGQSYGGYLALGALHRFPALLSGLALLIPVIEPSFDQRLLPGELKLRRSDYVMSGLSEEFLDGFRELIVDESPELAATLHESWIPSMETADQGFISRLQSEGYSFSGLDPARSSFSGPSLVVCGRHDAVVGFEQAMGLLPGLDRGTLTVLDGAGHLAQLEKPGLTRALVTDWLRRVEQSEDLLNQTRVG